MTPRDFQRKRVYDAEDFFRREIDLACATTGLIEVWGSTIRVPDELRFGSLDAVQTYVNRVIPDRTPRVVANGSADAHGKRDAHYSSLTHTIAIPERYLVRHNWSMREIVVLHECAHALRPPRPAHGAEFCRTFLELIEREMSPEAALLLRRSMIDHGVQIACAVV